MNLPANLPVTVSSASASRGERPADKDTAGMKFDDILLPKKPKASPGARGDQDGKQPTAWSWTQLDLSRNKMGWQVEASPAAIGEAADPETDDAIVVEAENPAEVDADAEAREHIEMVANNGLDEEQAQPQQDMRGEAGQDITTNAPAEPTEEVDADAEELAALAADRAAAGRPAAIDLQSRAAVQADGDARQAAALAAVDDRRAEARLASRERTGSIGERVPNMMNQGEPGTRDIPRPSPALGNGDRNERLSQRLNAEGDIRQAEGRVQTPLKSGSPVREDSLRSDPFGQRVTVVSSQTAPLTPPAPAPASLGLSSVSAQVTAAIREDVEQVSRAVAAQMEAQDSAGSRNRPVHTLQIQLQPADLGRVNARMSIDGTQLRIELQVETEQARAALAKDADSILKSLKAAGFDIDRVTIQQVQPTSNTSQTGSPERGTNAFASQGNGADESGDQGRQRGTGNGSGNASREGHDGAPQNDPRGGLFI